MEFCPSPNGTVTMLLNSSQQSLRGKILLSAAGVTYAMLLGVTGMVAPRK